MKLFVDAGPFIGLLNPKDPWHGEATQTIGEIAAGRLSYQRLFTSNYILNEVVTHTLHETRSHERALKALAVLEDTKYITRLHVSPEVHGRALELFRKTRHPLLSITDCTTAALMETHGIEAVFTFDRGFGKMGFKVVP